MPPLGSLRLSEVLQVSQRLSNEPAGRYVDAGERLALDL